MTGVQTCALPICGINKESLHVFIQTLNIPADAKQALLEMTPASYIGKAVELTKNI